MKRIIIIALLAVFALTMVVPVAFAGGPGTNPSGQDCVGNLLSSYAQNTDQGVSEEITVIVESSGGKVLADTFHYFRAVTCD